MKQIVFTRLVGGIGNQMFQYAAAVAISELTGYEVQIDLSAYDEYRLHNGFELHRTFKGPFIVADRDTVANYLGLRTYFGSRVAKLTTLNAMYRDRPILVDDESGKSPFLDLRLRQGLSGVYLSGYWQSINHFLGFDDRVKQSFQFGDKLNTENESLAYSINNTNSVAIHVRRGDYISSPSASAKHGVCSIEYYKNALQLIRSKVKDPIFYVFSDDTHWVKKVFPNLIDSFVLAEGNDGVKSNRDLELMAMCRHFIIANSTFSWWAAWLGQHADSSIVVYPEDWFKHGRVCEGMFDSNWFKCF